MAGNPRAPHTEGHAWLWPGQNSRALFVDVDWVVIAPGQRYYKSIMEMLKDGRIVTSGAIKVKDDVIIAEVAMSEKRFDVFYVYSWNTEYYTEAEVIKNRWISPLALKGNNKYEKKTY